MTRPLAPSPSTSLPMRPARVALVLGGGGARGLAHVAMIEALEELGIRPVAIAGTSIGAVYGAALAAGMTAAEIRSYTLEVLGQRIDLARQVFSARAPSLGGLWSLVTARSALLDAEALLKLLLPSRIPATFAELAIPLSVVATDFYAQEEAVLRDGALQRAIAASIALPAIFKPVMIDGRAMVDGGLVNPLPFDVVGDVDVVVAVDVTGAPRPTPERPAPTAIEALIGATYIFERTIIRERLRNRQPDIYVDAQVSNYQMADFFKAKDILAAAEPAKQLLKSQLVRVLSSEPLSST